MTDEEFSGRFTLRVDPQLHRKLKREADRQGKSMNEFIVDTMEKRMSLRFLPLHIVKGNGSQFYLAFDVAEELDGLSDGKGVADAS